MASTAVNLQRSDLVWIANNIAEGSRVLDLGCGDGALLSKLRDEKGCSVHGVEIDQSAARAAIADGIPVTCIDLDQTGLSMFLDNSFDSVVLSQTLMMIQFPDKLVREMLRVGAHSIVSYPNFAHWRVRAYLTLRGRMPVSKSIPFSWYETPNFHHTTIPDFHDFVHDLGGTLEEEIALKRESDDSYAPVRLLPNLFGETIVARISNGNTSSVK